MKTVSIGIRFLPEELEEMKKATGLTTAQQVVGFLIGFWKENRIVETVAVKKEIKKQKAGSFNPSNLQKEFDEVMSAQSKKKSYQDYLREAETIKDPIAFRAEVRSDKSLNVNQRSAIYARIKK